MLITTVSTKSYTASASSLFLLLLFLLRLWRRQLEGLGRAVLTGPNWLPCSRSSLEVAESLCQLERLSDDALLLLIVTNLGVSGQGEVLAQRVSLETIVRHDSSQVRVTDEEDTVQVVNLTLVPIGTTEQTGNARHGRGLVRIGLYSNAGVVSDREHVIDNLETLVAGGIVGGGNRAALSEFGGGVVLKNSEQWILNDDGIGSIHFKKEKTGMTPEGEI